jgi:hypothetical protein
MFTYNNNGLVNTIVLKHVSYVSVKYWDLKSFFEVYQIDDPDECFQVPMTYYEQFMRALQISGHMRRF